MVLFFKHFYQFWHLSEKISLIKWINRCLFTENVSCCDWLTQNLLLHYLTSRSRFFSLLSTRASALWCCRLARLESSRSLAWLVGKNKTIVFDQSVSYPCFKGVKSLGCLCCFLFWYSLTSIERGANFTCISKTTSKLSVYRWKIKCFFDIGYWKEYQLMKYNRKIVIQKTKRMLARTQWYQQIFWKFKIFRPIIFVTQ